MSLTFEIDTGLVTPEDICRVSFAPAGPRNLRVSTLVKGRVAASFNQLDRLLKEGHLIYGVNTGFGDSCTRIIGLDQAPALQENLVAYLLCGTGPALPTPVVRAMCFIRFVSLAQGMSGVSWELMERFQTYLENDWIPRVPRRGSLGASGDLIPLAYLAEALQGRGWVETPDGGRPVEELLQSSQITPYKLKAKEGLALVNGSSMMGGLALFNYQNARYLCDLAATMTAWACLALQGRPEAFSVLINDQAKDANGQSRVAKKIRTLLNENGYRPTALRDISVQDLRADQSIQDRYSLRCAPQIIGPIEETLDLLREWLGSEVQSVSDNPVISPEGELSNGGNFYGGYLSHGMDYLKICLGNLADLLDRQLATLIDEKSNRGLTPNLANWESMNENERHLHHGLKGLHQAVGAITSELMAQSHPNSVHSRSSESHNQDKVSLGMTGAASCMEMVDTFFELTSLYLVCLTQALDLRGVRVQGESRALYEEVRQIVPFVDKDRPLGQQVNTLANRLRRHAQTFGLS